MPEPLRVETVLATQICAESASLSLPVVLEQVAALLREQRFSDGTDFPAGQVADLRVRISDGYLWKVVITLEP